MALAQNQRPRFFEGQYLGANDLTAAVAYGRLQDARHALGAHTWGIAMGLQLKETTVPGGSVDVHILPGYARDGFGRPIVILAPYKLPAELFQAYVFDAAIDGGSPAGRLIEVWLRYDQRATQRPRPGFEVCDPADQLSRVQETFRVEVGQRRSHLDQHDRISVAGQSIDAQEALRAFDSAAPLVHDESVPFQAFPEEDAPARWLIPVGMVRWRPNPNANQPGNFVARVPDDLAKSRALRRYIGVVAESLQAADGILRLRDRAKDYSRFLSNDLVWVEGPMRVEGDVRLFGGKLDFRHVDGQDSDIPLKIQRTGDGALGARSLQVVLGPDTQTDNRFAVGPLKADNTVDEKLVILSGGNVGIGTPNPTQLLTLGAPEGTRLEIARTSASLPWIQASGEVNPGSFVINQQSQGSSQPLADFALMRDRKKRLSLGDVNTYLSSQDGGDLLFFANHEEAGQKELMRITGLGNVGIGVPTPLNTLHVAKPTHLNAIFECPDTPEHLTLVVGTNGSGLRFSETNDFFIASQPYSNRNDFGFGTEHFRITAAGNIGMGTSAPAQRLDVRGHIKLHTDGSLFAPGGVENLRILRGTIQSDGSIAAGSGFSVAHVGTGLYLITFDASFPVRPSAAVTQIFPDLDDFGNGGNTLDNAVIVGLNTQRMKVKTGASDGTERDRDFTFVVIGPR